MTNINTQQVRNLLKQANYVQIRVSCPYYRCNQVIEADDLYVTNELNGQIAINDFNERVWINKITSAKVDDETGLIYLQSDSFEDSFWDTYTAEIKVITWKE